MTLCVEIRSRRRRCVETRSRRRRVRVDFNADHDVPSREIRKHDDRRVVHVAQAVHGDGPALVPARAPRSPRSRRAEDRPPSSRSPRSRRTVPMFPLAAVPTHRPHVPTHRGPDAPRTVPVSPLAAVPTRRGRRPDSRRATVPRPSRVFAAATPRPTHGQSRSSPRRRDSVQNASAPPRRSPKCLGGHRSATKSSRVHSRAAAALAPRAQARRRVAGPTCVRRARARAAAVAAGLKARDKRCSLLLHRGVLRTHEAQSCLAAARRVPQRYAWRRLRPSPLRDI